MDIALSDLKHRLASDRIVSYEKGSLTFQDATLCPCLLVPVVLREEALFSGCARSIRDASYLISDPNIATPELVAIRLVYNAIQVALSRGWHTES